MQRMVLIDPLWSHPSLKNASVVVGDTVSAGERLPGGRMMDMDRGECLPCGRMMDRGELEGTVARIDADLASLSTPAHVDIDAPPLLPLPHNYTTSLPGDDTPLPLPRPLPPAAALSLSASQRAEPLVRHLLRGSVRLRPCGGQSPPSLLLVPHCFSFSLLAR